VKRFCLPMVFLVVLLTILVACTPKATPAPATPPGKATTQPTATSATPSPADANWQKAVQASKSEGKLSVYSFNLTGDVGNAVTKAVKRDLGLDMEVITGPGAQLVERIKSERRSGQFLVDVMDGSPALIVQSKQDSSTVKWTDLPATREKGVWTFGPLLDKDGHLMWWIPNFFMPYYNTNLVKAGEEPKAWKDFLDPKWKGKIGISNPDTVPTLNRMYIVMTTRGVLNASYFTELAKQDIKFFPTFRDDIAAAGRGEISLDLSSSPTVANPLVKQGAPVRPFDISEGIMATGAAVVAIKDAPHPNAAQVYMNWLLTKEGQAIVHEAIGSTALRSDVTDFTPQQVVVKNAKVLAETEEDVIEGARLQRERVLGKMFAKQ